MIGAHTDGHMGYGAQESTYIPSVHEREATGDRRSQAEDPSFVHGYCHSPIDRRSTQLQRNKREKGGRTV